MPRTVNVLCAALVAVAIAGCSSSSPSEGSADAATPDGSFCSLFVAFRASNDSLDAELNSGDTDRTEAAVKRLVGQTELLRRKAPAEIKADVNIVSAYLTDLNALLDEYGYDIDAFVGDEDAAARYVELSSEDVDSALLQLRTYGDTECSPATSTSSVSVSTTIAG